MRMKYAGRLMLIFIFAGPMSAVSPASGTVATLTLQDAENLVMAELHHEHRTSFGAWS